MAVCLYSASTTLSAGSQVFLDEYLTLKAIDGVYSDGTSAYTVVDGQITTVDPC